MLISFLCAWLGVELISLDVHGGTTEADIIQTFDRATKVLEASKCVSDVYVFLDEINTCAHMGVITEAICHRSINGNRLHEGIKILAALNPYRIRPVKSNEDIVNAGLEYIPASQSTSTASSDELNTAISMKNLVYKVHPIPPTLRDFIFDFGSLNDTTEMLYISSMVDKQLEMETVPEEREIISTLIGRSQQYIREFEGDPSVVSLRDVQRCIKLLNWFSSKFGTNKVGQKISSLCRALVLAIAHVYGYRLPTTSARYSFWIKISSIANSFGKAAVKVKFDALGKHGTAQNILENMQRRFVNNLVVEPGIALNQALTENLFVTIICILNVIPIFIVGKPGTSKTLAIQIIASNLQGKQSIKPLWRKFPAVYLFQYQCSPLSTSASILFQYEAAKSYQEHSQDVLTVLLLDEVGLAENSPDMPLKVLHYMLVDPPIAIVGLSNWVLDSSKMNRAVCLQRPEPSADDISYTGQNILFAGGSVGDTEENNIEMPTLKREVSSSNKLQPWLFNLAKVFHSLYSKQQEVFGEHSRDFIGMRDYYSLLKQLRLSGTDVNVDPETLSYGVCRNFGGKPESMTKILKLFCETCFGSSISPNHPCFSSLPAIKLIGDNLQSVFSRHLMVLSPNDSALQLLIGCDVISLVNSTVLIGSRFKDDIQELHLIQQINKVNKYIIIIYNLMHSLTMVMSQVKNAMERGQVVTLLHNESMFESLYDILNQRYVSRTDIETGKEQKLLRLALGPRSQLCPVSEGFKLIVIVDQQQAYDTLDLPLLNRFEKQVLNPEDLLGEQEKLIVSQLSEWSDLVLNECKFPSLSDIFCGFYSGTLSSLLLAITNYGKTSIASQDAEQVLNEAKRQLLAIAFPTALIKSPTLAEVSQLVSTNDNNLGTKGYESLGEFLDEMYAQRTSRSNYPANYLTEFKVLLTKSSASHFHLAHDSWLNNYTGKAAAGNLCKFIQLALVPSERFLVKEVESFFAASSQSSNSVMIFVCDPMLCSNSVISHARFIVDRVCANTSASIGGTLKSVVFIIHLPTGIKERERYYIVNFSNKWKHIFIDDLRSPKDLSGFSLTEMLQKSAFELFENNMETLRDIIFQNYQSALARHSSPVLDQPLPVTYVKMLKDLLQQEAFVVYITACVLESLKQFSETSEGGLHFHVMVACGDYNLVAGSFRHALQLSIQAMVIQALGHSLRYIDRDFNIALLHQNANVNGTEVDENSTKWLMLGNKLCSPELVARSCPIVPPSKLYEVDTLVHNTGLHGPLKCEIPFSEKIISILNHSSTKSAIETLANDDATISVSLEQLSKSANMLLESVYGAEAMEAFQYFLNRTPGAYLHDYVLSSIHPFHGVSASSHIRFMESILRICYKRDNHLSTYLPSIVHVCHWMYQTCMFHTFSLLSIDSSCKNEFSSYQQKKWSAANATSLEMYLIESLENKIEESVLSDSDYSVESFICEIVLKYLDKQFQYCLECDIKDGLELKDEKRNPYSMLKMWGTIFSRMKPDLRVLIVMCISQKETNTSSILHSDDKALLKMWWGLCGVTSLTMKS
jgi:hypothetical protein